MKDCGGVHNIGGKEGSPTVHQLLLRKAYPKPSLTLVPLVPIEDQVWLYVLQSFRLAPLCPNRRGSQ